MLTNLYSDGNLKLISPPRDAIPREEIQVAEDRGGREF
jgi:hypothetical protein